MINKLSGLIVFCACLSVVNVLAADKSTVAAPAMDAMMKQMMEASTPGAAHARLKAMEGSWTASTRMWMKPGDKADESLGRSNFVWVLDGRFLRQDFVGDWMGKKFEGMGFMGYDNVRKEYVNTWMDSMGTAMMYSTGQYDEATQTIKDEGTSSCPMTGEKNRWFRSEWKLPTGDTSTYIMYAKDEKGKEFKSLEIIYKRAK
jgi:hypothetical protein